MEKNGSLNSLILIGAILFTTVAGVSSANVVIRIVESGNDLVVTTSGNVNIDDWGQPDGTSSTSPRVSISPNSSGGFHVIGTGSQDWWSDPGSGYFKFTDNGLRDADFYTLNVNLVSGGGDVAFHTTHQVSLPEGYVSGETIDQVLTIPGESYSSIGVHEGESATISWCGSNPDSITIVIGPDSTAAHPPDCIEQVNRWPYGPAYGVAAYRDYAYFGSGTVLQIADISNPSALSVISSLELPGVVREIVSADDLLYVANGVGGLRIIDVTDPRKPNEIGFFATSGSAYRIHLADGRAYVTDNLVGFSIIDVSDPSDPVELGVFGTTADAIRDIVVVGDLAYLAGQRASRMGFFVADVSDPSSPFEISHSDLGWPGYGVAVSGDHAYVANRSLHVINVATPWAPVEVGYMDTVYAVGIEIYGDTGYVLSASYGLLLLDLSNPEIPTEIALADTPGVVEGVTVTDHHAFVADSYAGLRIFDLGTPSNPAEVGFIDTPGYAEDVTVANGYAFVSSYYDGVHVIDVEAAPSSPAVGTYVSPGYSNSVAVVGDLMYVAGGHMGLRIVEVSDPTDPTEIGFFDTPGSALHVAVEGAYAYVADNTEGLRVIDIGTPATPTEVGACDTPGLATGVAVLGGYAYVADSSEGLRVIDVSTPAAPIEVGHVVDPSYAKKVDVVGQHAYVVGAVLSIVDVGTPSDPVEVGFYDTPGSPRDVEVIAGLAYVADHMGLRVIDVSTPSDPIQVEYFPQPWPTLGVDLSSGIIHLAVDNAGLTLLRWNTFVFVDDFETGNTSNWSQMDGYTPDG